MQQLRYAARAAALDFGLSCLVNIRPNDLGMLGIKAVVQKLYDPDWEPLY